MIHKVMFCFVAILNVSLFTKPAEATSLNKSTRPNIVIIMADDMGWSDLGCYGGEIRTPHIDSLASDGIRFTQFYNNAICGPTRASLLTGLYCQQVGHPGTRWNEPKDFSKCVTIAELLQNDGYHTMMVGKWQGRDLAVKRGFDRFFGPNCRAKISYFDEVQKNSFYLNKQRWKFPKTKEKFLMTDAFSDYAVRFVKEAVNNKKPFFLYAAYIAPHWPLHAREEDIARYRKMYQEQGWDQYRTERFQKQQSLGIIPKTWNLSPKPTSLSDWKNDKHKKWQAERMAVYAAQISCMDRGVGKILEAIKSAGVEDNTLVMFLSDNGAAPDGGLNPSNSGFGFEPKRKNNKWRLDGVPIRPGSGPNVMPGPADTFAGYGLAWANVSNTPLRGTKLTAWEGGIRTPLIVRWPSVIPKGSQITRQPGHVIDLMATCLDVAKCEYPINFKGRKPLIMEGKSLVPILQGQKRKPHDILCWDVPRNQAIRMGQWKLINKGRSKPWELYDMENDSTETTNLSKQYPEQVKRMSEQFKKWQQRVEVN